MSRMNKAREDGWNNLVNSLEYNESEVRSYIKSVSFLTAGKHNILFTWFAQRS